VLLAIALTLAATPSAAALAEAGGLRGALVKVQATAGQAAEEIPLSQMTHQQLRAEYQRLDETRPGLGGQITMVALGGVAIAAGFVVLWGTFLISASSFFASVPLIPLLVGVGLIAGGGVILAIGIVMLKLAIAERRPYGEAMDEIRARLDGTYEGQNPPPPPEQPVAPPPPPPPLPPQAGLDAVRPSLVLATF
jgi:hypothetical protein